MFQSDKFAEIQHFGGDIIDDNQAEVITLNACIIVPEQVHPPDVIFM